ncbi:DUF4105 domain-containing protein [Flavobacterium sp. F372]|uniref:DUF4105 domain-containing protein n=1 Tax=Flavobacterium bernardetii TaxID=2813823 RepID=A0ABR7IY36_9FLAO|nr:DUF4105 domain-containing protein [Flavobacterium bernardetii]MBC5834685.1 DUF4105 domain-containing protein [Flavobacterium bernardetii]NHF70333.1 DUF4105 domain-containing protein [Flavobacterium bernardetii]
MLKKLLFLLFPILSFSQNVTLSDNAKVSILTCGTAPVSYAMYGHTGIRITDFVNQIDVVYNYGAFDFTTPNFMMKFVKGDLQYFVTNENYYDFEFNYKQDGRSIVEQELNLTPLQKQQLLNELSNSLTSDERFYTYKFIDKNCTTMVVDKINKILGSEVLKQPKSEQSYRDILYPYMSDFYMKLGIQIIFGTKVDQPATRLFLPLEFEKVLETATQNGQKIAQPTKILNQGTDNVPFSYINSTYSLLAAIVILILLNKKGIQIAYFIFAGLLGLFFSLVGLYSLHEEILWNYNILLFNPLLLVFAFYYWKNNTSKIILFGQICIACTLIYLAYIVSKVQLLIILPIVSLHLFWLIKIVMKVKKK